MPKVSICIPAYNQERLIAESIHSALEQDFIDKEILLIDDASIDDTFEIANKFPIRIFKNERNFGLGGNLNELIKKSNSPYIVLLCQDDIFTHPSVVSDMVKIFEDNPRIGIIGRYYYQYLDGHKGAVMTIRGDIFTSSCQPSGIGFRRSAFQGKFVNKIFIEIPLMVKRIIDAGWESYIIKYDTIAARLHFGKKGNAAIRPSYYRTYPQQSPTRNWYEVLGEPIGMYMGFIQIKNRAEWLLINEIKETIKFNPKCLLNVGFWFCALIALIIPSFVLKHLSNFYRHKITRRFVKIIERNENP